MVNFTSKAILLIISYLSPLNLTEVVLSALLTSFRFALTDDDDIKWNRAGVAYPSVGDGKPSMPVRLEII